MNINGIELPNRPLSNFDIDYYVNKLGIPSFRGTFMRDSLPKKLLKSECAIVNLDDSDGPGTHWVCYWVDPDASYYFDSFGLSMPDELYDYLNKPILMNELEIQDRNDVICGHLCLKVLKDLQVNNGKPSSHGFRYNSFKKSIFSLI